MDFAKELLSQPWWLVVWIGGMGAVNMAALAFVGRIEARWTLAAFTAAFVTMNLLHAVVGYVRLLGLAHVLFWTPLLIYLWPRLSSYPSSSAYGLWLRLLFATNAVSLIIDYVDVIRYVFGDRS